MKVTSSLTGRLLTQLKDEKAYLLKRESDGAKVISKTVEVDLPENFFKYSKTEKLLEETDKKLLGLHHAQRCHNVLSQIDVGGKIYSADELIIIIGQLKKRLEVLSGLREKKSDEKMWDKDFDEWKTIRLTYDPEKVNTDYKEMRARLNLYEKALADFNINDEYEVDY